MIPSHDLDIIQNQKIVTVKLDTLQSYDFGVPHRHEYFELFYFEKGAGKHMIDFVDIPISNYEVQLVGPGQVHQVMREKDTNGYVILFHQNIFEEDDLLSDFLLNAACSDATINPFVFNFKYSETVPFYMSQLWKMKDVDSSLELHQQRLFLAQLIAECAKKVHGDGNQIHSDYLTFRKKLRIHFKSLHQVQDYSQLMGCSEKTLNELTKKHTGKRASQLIHEHIILEAKRLLMMGSSVKETAFDLGFDDPAHFSKFFKSKTNQSPKDFKNVHA